MTKPITPQEAIEIMAREENKSKYSNIEHIRTNMLWMDIKIVDPEMEALMKQINEEQTRLKEALREKLRLMKYDTDVILKENEQKKEWLQCKGIQLEEKDHLVIKMENEVRIKEEPIDTMTNRNEYQEEKMMMQFPKELSHTEKVNNNITVQARDTEVEVSRLKICNKQKESKDDMSKKYNQIIKEETDDSDNSESMKEESVAATRTCLSTLVEPVEDILLNEKKLKHGMKRRRILKKYKVTLKRKKNAKEKTEEVQNNKDFESTNLLFRPIKMFGKIFAFKI
ncbi:myosin-9-like [Vespula squamosa]|uniref:Myosin-9-like n=1 Tax=Vespula squamosa TaxID=30214 RepID=A0ABD2AP36_VESSQ